MWLELMLAATLGSEPMPASSFSGLTKEEIKRMWGINNKTRPKGSLWQVRHEAHPRACVIGCMCDETLLATRAQELRREEIADAKELLFNTVPLEVRAVFSPCEMPPAVHLQTLRYAHANPAICICKPCHRRCARLMILSRVTRWPLQARRFGAPPATNASVAKVTARRILAAAAKLEEYSLTTEDAASDPNLNGSWRCIYSTSSEITTLEALPYGFKLKAVYQPIDQSAGIFENQALVQHQMRLATGSTRLVGDIQVAPRGAKNRGGVVNDRGQRVHVFFRRIIFSVDSISGFGTGGRLTKIMAPKPQPGATQTSIDVTYLDSDFRITRDGREGVLHLHVKEPTPVPMLRGEQRQQLLDTEGETVYTRAGLSNWTKEAWDSSKLGQDSKEFWSKPRGWFKGGVGDTMPEGEDAQVGPPPPPAPPAPPGWLDAGSSGVQTLKRCGAMVSIYLASTFDKVSSAWQQGEAPPKDSAKDKDGGEGGCDALDSLEDWDSVNIELPATPEASTDEPDGFIPFPVPPELLREWQRVLPGRRIFPGGELTGPLPLSSSGWEDLYRIVLSPKSPRYPAQPDTINQFVARPSTRPGGAGVVGSDAKAISQSADRSRAPRSDLFNESAAVGIGLISGLAFGGAVAWAVSALASKRSHGRGRVGWQHGSVRNGGAGSALASEISATEQIGRRESTSSTFEMSC